MHWTRTFGIVVALGLGAYAIALMLGSEHATTPAEVEVVDAEDEKIDRQEAIRRVRGAAVVGRFQGLPLEALGEDEEAGLEAPDANSLGSFSREEARFGFDYLMRRVDATTRSKRKLTQSQWHEVYRTANDTFTALSTQLDARDPAQAAELERAHKRLVESLEGLRVRGGKFKQF